MGPAHIHIYTHIHIYIYMCIELTRVWREEGGERERRYRTCTGQREGGEEGSVGPKGRGGGVGGWRTLVCINLGNTGWKIDIRIEIIDGGW